MHQRTHYEVLNITSQSSLPDVKRAYKDLLLATHPDKYQSSTISSTQKNIHSIDVIKEAYRILGDEKLRKQYDENLLEEGKKRGIYKFGDGVDEVSLDTFEPVDLNDQDSDIMHYIRKCPRCQVSDGFKVNDALLEEYAVICDDSDEGKFQVLIQCDSCSLWLKVHFFAADEDLSDEN